TAGTKRIVSTLGICGDASHYTTRSRGQPPVGRRNNCWPVLNVVAASGPPRRVLEPTSGASRAATAHGKIRPAGRHPTPAPWPRASPPEAAVGLGDGLLPGPALRVISVGAVR